MPAARNTRGTTKASDKPANVDFDLEALDHETPDPLAFSYKGKRYVVTDPGNIDWTTWDKIPDNNPAAVLKVIMGDEQWKKLTTTPGLKSWHLGQLVNKVQEHFAGVSQGEGDAS